MYKIIITLIIIFFYFLRIILNSKKNNHHLLISCFVFFIPFAFSFFEFPSPPSFRTGAFNKALSLEIIFILGLIFLFFLLIKKIPIFIKNKRIVSILVIFCFFLISFFNPNNLYIVSSIVFFLRLIIIIFIFNIIFRLYSYNLILKGFYDGMFWLTLLQFVLAICFPILGITKVLALFQPELVELAIGGRGGRYSAIGIFAHPGDLGLFSCISASYFFSNYLFGINKKKSFYLFIFSCITLFLALSRNAILVGLITLPLLFIIYKKPHISIFRLKRVISIIFLSSLFLSFFYFFTNLGKMFQGDNFEMMKEARFIHWNAAYVGFLENPFFGVGLNTHLIYLREKFTLLEGFFAEHPVHNIHLQILVELGIVGLLFWLLFFILNILKSQTFIKDIFIKNNIKAFQLFFIGTLISFFIYGFMGWAGFKENIFTLVLFIVFAANKLRNNLQLNNS